MIVDSSAIVAIALQEPGFEELLEKVARARTVRVGVPTLTETAIVLSARLNQDARGVLSRFLMEGSIVTIPFGDAHFATAVDAWLCYGKGRHPASLNFGDCLSYATARLAGEPLLCIGNDFSQTDLPLA
ncbi:MAG: type II toxin-antitoxin system VapC family toxin [Candidatus Competibacteraceae bacterium]